MQCERMSKWRVLKLVKGNGNVPFEKWYKGLTMADQAKVDAAVSLIESVTKIPAEKVKKYKELFEIKIFGNGTALRPLAIKDGEGKLIVLIVGTTKKGRIPEQQYEAALTLAKSYWDRNCDTKGYWEA